MHEKDILENILLNDTVQKTILLIDDDVDEHEIFQSALKNTNNIFKFLSAESCEEGIDILKKFEPDYIFIDVNMPRQNGIACLEKIKKINKISHVPVYMYSTGMNARDNQKALQLGAVDYIIKPSNIKLLSSMLNKILN